MKNKLSLILFLTIILASCKSQETTSHNTNNTLHKIELDTSIINLLNSQATKFNENTKLSIALVQNDTVSFYGGMKNGNEFKIEDNSSSLFEIGSITKVFTSHLLMNSVIENHVSLDAPISSYLEIDSDSIGQITLRQLASHSSGLPTMPASFFENLTDSLNPYKEYSSEKLLYDLNNDISIDEEFAGKFNYSNYGMSLIGYILSQKKGRPYQELLNEAILSPIGMDHTIIDINESNKKLVNGYANGVPAIPWDMNAISPAGGIISNTGDIAKYINSIWMENSKIFEQLTEFEVPRNKSISQTIGWMKIKSKKGNPYFFHSGRTGGYSSIIILRPSSKMGIIVLSNISEDNNNIDNLGFKVMKKFIEIN